MFPIYQMRRQSFRIQLSAVGGCVGSAQAPLPCSVKMKERLRDLVKEAGSGSCPASLCRHPACHRPRVIFDGEEGPFAGAREGALTVPRPLEGAVESGP